MLLVERNEELALLQRQFDDSQAGTGRLVLVTGPVASGKTELLFTFAERATRAGALFLCAAGSNTEQALPLSAIGQLFHGAGLTPAGLDRATAVLLRDGPPDAGCASAAGSDQRLAGVLAAVSDTLLDLARRQPVMIGVDDLHLVDPPSLRCLLHLVRRMRSARIFVVLNEVTCPRPAEPVLHAELTGQPHCSRIRLGPLSRRGVVDLLGSHVDEVRAHKLATACHQATGGNPLLVHALAQDQSTDVDVRIPQPTSPLLVGESFDQAVVSYLYRSEPEQLQIARALAVLDGATSADAPAPRLTGRLAGVDPAAAARLVTSLNLGGLLDAGRFRHPRARTAILDNVPPDERAALHRRAAELLNEDGAPATVVAGHLLAADRFDFPWAAAILRTAAERALDDGDAPLATEYLKRAQHCCADDRQRAVIRSGLAGAEWRQDPATARRHLDDLAAAVRAGDLTGRGALTTVRHLLWWGRIDEAAALLDLVGAAADDRAEEIAADLRFTRLWQSYLNPLPRTGTTAVPTRAAEKATVARAEEVLRRSPLDDWTIAPKLAAIAALVRADRLDLASLWCDRLRSLAGARNAPAWQAMLSAVRAEIALRTGDLAAAREHGRAALEYIPPQSWGVAVGLPVATRLRAATARGDFDEAARLLHEPVPDAMFQTTFGLLYLHARGQYYLATGQARAALDDFRACGSLMSGWGLDLPALVPWRVEAAQAWLRLGNSHRARELADDQLRRLGAGRSRSHAITLRVLAAASDVGERPGLLTEAVDILQDCGDRLELARTLLGRSRAHCELGATGEADTDAARALRLARDCGADPLVRCLSPDRAAPRTPTVPRPVPDEPEVLRIPLSDAEGRVATLAAQGKTNREIARLLFVTVSTVEQHLTRVYRKLNVSRRTELAALLHADLADTA